MQSGLGCPCSTLAEPNWNCNICLSKDGKMLALDIHWMLERDETKEGSRPFQTLSNW